MCPDSSTFGTHMFDMMLAATVTSLYYQYVVSAEQHALKILFPCFAGRQVVQCQFEIIV